MRKLTHRPFIKTIAVAALLMTGGATAQTQELEQVGRLISDALFFSDQYITPAADAAVYQAASGWISSPKKPELWDVNLALHINVFVTPQSDRRFTIYNSDFTFFQLEQGTQASVPTALGNKDQVYLSGELGGSPLRLETPQGMNMEVVAYPYLQGSLGLWYGTELVVKYSPQVNLKKSNYQVYGFGLKHNFSQYFKGLGEKKIHFAALAAWSKEDVSFDFLNVQTDYGSLGINQINGLVDTWQFQLSGSKEFGKWEAMGSFMVSTSDIKYRDTGETGTIEETIPLQQILNERLKSIYKTRINYIGEAAITYNIGNFKVQTILAFGKFINSNVSLQYLFN